MKVRTTKRFIASLIGIVICFSMLLGTTYAWFTDMIVNTNNVITSGNIDVELWHSTYKDSAESSSWGVGFGYSDEKGTEVDETTKLFLNENNEEILWEPGAAAVENFRIKNTGTLALKYEFTIKPINQTATKEGNKLADILKIYIDEIKWQDNGVPTGIEIVAGQVFGDGYTVKGDLLAGESFDFWVGLEWEPSENDNAYNVKGGLSLLLGIDLVATQLSYELDGIVGNGFDSSAQFPEVNYPDFWDGFVDTSWYDAENPKTEYIFTTAEQLMGLSELCSDDITFEGVTFKLANDLDLYCEDTSENADGDPVTFRPIGDHSKNGTFEGTFDGQDHTISNLYQNGWDLGYEWGKYGSYGLFGNVNNATIKNLNIEGSESYIEGGDTSFVVGSATGTCVFENITIKNSISATYNNGNGGIIGWSGAGNYTFKNITIAEDCVLAGLWGSFDSSIGGIVGQAELGATYNFENVNVACRIDAYNDCTASYDYYNYRMCGMLIGRMEETTTIEGANYPDTSKYNLNFTDVTVTYGDWANYHYCRADGARAKRVEAGYSYDGIAADYNHTQCTIHCKKLIAFDQIFGGDQFAVKGLKEYDGVTVVYNNK